MLADMSIFTDLTEITPANYCIFLPMVIFGQVLSLFSVPLRVLVLIFSDSLSVLMQNSSTVQLSVSQHCGILSKTFTSTIFSILKSTASTDSLYST